MVGEWAKWWWWWWWGFLLHLCWAIRAEQVFVRVYVFFTQHLRFSERCFVWSNLNSDYSINIGRHRDEGNEETPEKTGKTICKCWSSVWSGLESRETHSTNAKSNNIIKCARHCHHLPRFFGIAHNMYIWHTVPRLTLSAKGMPINGECEARKYSKHAGWHGWERDRAKQRLCALKRSFIEYRCVVFCSETDGDWGKQLLLSTAFVAVVVFSSLSFDYLCNMHEIFKWKWEYIIWMEWNIRKLAWLHQRFKRRVAKENTLAHRALWTEICWMASVYEWMTQSDVTVMNRIE